MANTEDHLHKVLNKVAVENKYQNYEIIIKEISSGGANYTSKLFTVIIREPNKDDLHLFAKYAAVGEATRNLMRINIFEIEVKAYTKLWKVYEALEKEHGLPEEHKLLFTKCYDFDLTPYQETLILENLIARGYGPCDRFQSIDWEYASAAVTELAKMHALSFAYSDQYPEEFEQFLTGIKREMKPDILYGWLQGAKSSAIKAVRPEYREALDIFLKKYLKSLLPTFYAPTRRTIIVHGDYNANNLLHKVREDGTVDIKIVDLQTLQGGSPVTDLLYFIFTGSDEQFRGQYYEKLVDHYYTQLSESMKRLHLNPDEVYSREDFDYELKEKLPFGLALAVLSLPVVTVGTEDAPQVNEDLNLTSFTFEKTSDLYVERLNGVVNDYVKWGILK